MELDIANIKQEVTESLDLLGLNGEDDTDYYDNIDDIVYPSTSNGTASPNVDDDQLDTEKDANKGKEFLVLDEVNHESDKNFDSDSDSSDEGDFDEVPDDEIEAMLDEGLPEGYKGERKKKECPYIQKKKIHLEEKGVNHFEILPLGWLVVTHNSGMPLYLHKPTRVCTLAKPYFLGPGSVRKHEIPVSAIPCYSYRKALTEEQKQINEPRITNGHKNPETAEAGTSPTQKRRPENTAEDETSIPAAKKQKVDENASNQGSKQSKVVNMELLKKLVNTEDNDVNNSQALAMMPNARVETAKENWENHHMKHEEVTEYCKKLFKFKYVNIMRFKSWCERRKYNKVKKALQRPTLPDDTKLITFPLQTNTNGDAVDGNGAANAVRKECLMNPKGKSFVCILHEYVQRALKKQPTYEFKELENGSTPYSATVSINGMRYGVGYGTSKRSAKSAAAKNSIEILIPEMREQVNQGAQADGVPNKANDQDIAFFDDVDIQDPRVADFCAKTMEPSPHTVLQTCLSRNFGVGDREIKYEMSTLKHKKNEFTMSVGKHKATVSCKNKKDGKQKASQAILQAMHPNVSSWGSLLRLYGPRSVKSFKEKKQEEQEITLLQSKAAVNQPNFAILEKLNLEMSKLSKQETVVTPIGKLIINEELPKHSESNLNNVDL